MEVAKREEDGLNLGIFLLKFFTNKECEGSEQVGLKASGWLVSQFD